MTNFKPPFLGEFRTQNRCTPMTWRKLDCSARVGQPRTYYVPVDSPEPGADVHVDLHDPRSQGYGGQTLEFPLEDGTVDKVKGPWHTNSDALFSDTGLDLRDQHLTFVVLAREWNTRTGELEDVLYQDPAPIVGSFDRYKAIAEQFRSEPTLYAYSQSSGGSLTGCLWDRSRNFERN